EQMVNGNTGEVNYALGFTNTGGTGIGLEENRHYIEDKMGGKFNIFSFKGKGSIHRITWPALDKNSSPVVAESIREQNEKDIIHLQDVAIRGWNALSENAKRLLLNPKRAVWQVNFTPMVYYEIYTFFNPTDITLWGKIFLKAYRELLGLQLGSENCQARSLIGQIVQTAALREINLPEPAVATLKKYIYCINDSEEEFELKIDRCLELFDDPLNREWEYLYRYSAVIYDIYSQSAQWIAERTDRKLSGQCDEHDLNGGLGDFILADYIKKFNLLRIEVLREISQIRWHILGGDMVRAVNAFRSTLLIYAVEPAKGQIFNSRVSDYNADILNVSIDKVKKLYKQFPADKYRHPQVIALIKAEISRMQGEGLNVSGVAEEIDMIRLSLEEFSGRISLIGIFCRNIVLPAIKELGPENEIIDALSVKLAAAQQACDFIAGSLNSRDNKHFEEIINRMCSSYLEICDYLDFINLFITEDSAMLNAGGLGKAKEALINNSRLMHNYVLAMQKYSEYVIEQAELLNEVIAGLNIEIASFASSPLPLIQDVGIDPADISYYHTIGEKLINQSASTYPEAWAKHRKLITRQILKAAKKFKSGICIVLGPGYLPGGVLDGLARHFDEIKLIDLDIYSVNRTIDEIDPAYRNKFTFLQEDISLMALHIIEQGREAANRSGSTIEAYQAIKDMFKVIVLQDWPVLDLGKSDLVVSYFCYSQLSAYPLNRIKMMFPADKGFFNDDEWRSIEDQFCRKIENEHFRFLHSSIKENSKALLMDTPLVMITHKMSGRFFWQMVDVAFTTLQLFHEDVYSLAGKYGFKIESKRLWDWWVQPTYLPYYIGREKGQKNLVLSLRLKKKETVSNPIGTVGRNGESEASSPVNTFSVPVHFNPRLFSKDGGENYIVNTYSYNQLPLGDGIFDSFVRASLSMHRLRDFAIQGKCAKVAELLSIQLKAYLPAIKALGLLKSGWLGNKRDDLEYPKNWGSILQQYGYDCHYLLYFNYGGYHFALDATSLEYRYQDFKNDIYPVEIFYANTLEELDKLLCYLYGSKGWETVDISTPAENSVTDAVYYTGYFRTINEYLQRHPEAFIYLRNVYNPVMPPYIFFKILPKYFLESVFVSLTGEADGYSIYDADRGSKLSLLDLKKQKNVLLGGKRVISVAQKKSQISSSPLNKFDLKIASRQLQVLKRKLQNYPNIYGAFVWFKHLRLDTSGINVTPAEIGVIVSRDIRELHLTKDPEKVENAFRIIKPLISVPFKEALTLVDPQYMEDEKVILSEDYLDGRQLKMLKHIRKYELDILDIENVGLIMHRGWEKEIAVHNEDIRWVSKHGKMNEILHGKRGHNDYPSTFDIFYDLRLSKQGFLYNKTGIRGFRLKGQRFVNEADGRAWKPTRREMQEYDAYFGRTLYKPQGPVNKYKAIGVDLDRYTLKWRKIPADFRFGQPAGYFSTASSPAEENVDSLFAQAKEQLSLGNISPAAVLAVKAVKLIQQLPPEIKFKFKRGTAGHVLEQLCDGRIFVSDDLRVFLKLINEGKSNDAIRQVIQSLRISEGPGLNHSSSPAQIEIKELSFNDIEQLLSFRKKYFVHELKQERRRVANTVTRKWLNGLLRGEFTGHIFVARRMGALVGYVIASYDRGLADAEISEMAVVPSARKKGLGRRLFELAHKRLIAKSGIRFIDINDLSKTAASRKIALSLGYEKIGDERYRFFKDRPAGNSPIPQKQVLTSREALAARLEETRVILAQKFSGFGIISILYQGVDIKKNDSIEVMQKKAVQLVSKLALLVKDAKKDITLEEARKL
ncbi:MAG: GNAT family N-acetyltransferase, partial [Candidatus Omnitrophota bacterium]